MTSTLLTAKFWWRLPLFYWFLLAAFLSVISRSEELQMCDHVPQISINRGRDYPIWDNQGQFYPIWDNQGQFYLIINKGAIKKNKSPLDSGVSTKAT